MTALHSEMSRYQWTRPLQVAVLTAMSVFALTRASAQDVTPSNTAPVVRFMDSSTCVVGWVDISQIPLDQLTAFVADLNPYNRERDISQPEAVQDALVKLGVTNVFWVTDLAGMTSGPQAAIIPAPPANMNSVALILEALADKFNGKAVIDGDIAMIGTSEAVAALQGERKGQPSAEFLATAGRLSGPNGLAVRIPRMALAPMISVLPEVLGKDSELIARASELLIGLSAISISGDLPPAKNDIRIVTDSKETASGLTELVNRWTADRIGDAAGSLKFRADENSLRLQTTSAKEAGATIRSFLQLLQPAQRQAQQRSTVNSLRQMALGLHNFHDSYGFLPPQALADDTGIRLLSWRVLILPYLGHHDLYQQFHLDEPWDSEHNRKLIAKMPEVFRTRSGDDAEMEPGKTRLVAPLTKQSIFGRKGPSVKFREIIDGLSNTLLIVETSPENAVVWTQPKDLIVDEQDPRASLVNEATGVCSVCLSDGSVRVLPRTVSVRTLKALLTFNGKEVIDHADLE